MYVAMTRPTHLLCMALRSSSIGEGAAREVNEAGVSATYHRDKDHLSHHSVGSFNQNYLSYHPPNT